MATIKVEVHYDGVDSDAESDAIKTIVAFATAFRMSPQIHVACYDTHVTQYYTVEDDRAADILFVLNLLPMVYSELQ